MTLYSAMIFQSVSGFLFSDSMMIFSEVLYFIVSA